MTKKRNAKLDALARALTWTGAAKKKAGTKYSAKARAIAELIDESDAFGCETESVRKLCELLVGSRLPPTEEDDDHRKIAPGYAFVCTRDGMSHDYGVNRVAIASKRERNSGSLRLANGERGNTPYHQRYATLAEVRAALEKASPAIRLAAVALAAETRPEVAEEFA